VTRAERLSSTAVRVPALALAAAAVNLAVTVPLAALLNIWQDEAYTLHTIGRGAGYAFAEAIGFEQNAPLYFVLMTVWRHFGHGVFQLRLFSVLCIAVTVLLTPAIARRYVPQINPLLPAAVVACNPFMVWAAVEMRVYAMIVLVSALLLLTFHDAFVKKPPSAASAAAYAACVAVALYTQYYMAFLIAAQGISAAIYYRRSLLRFALAGAAGALAFVPMLAIIPAQVQNFKDGFASPSLVRALVGLVGILLRYVLPLPVAHSKIFYALIVAGVAVALLVARRKRGGSGSPAVLVTTAGAVALFAVGTYASGVHVLDRHAASLYLPATIGVFALFAYLPGPLARRLTLGWTCAIALLSVLTLARTYQALAKPGDWPRVAAYLQAHETGGQPIAVFEAENALPLSFYYRGSNRVVPIPNGIDFRRYRVSRFVVHDEAELTGALPRQRWLWLVTAGACTSANVQFGCVTLERFVSQCYRVRSDVEFFGSEVRELEQRSMPPAVPSKFPAGCWHN
jgi:hypothetical protein